MARLYRDGEVDDGWTNGFESVGAPTELIPTEWVGHYVLNRAAEAQDILRRTRLGSFWPKEFGTIWPDYELEEDKFWAKVSLPDLVELASKKLIQQTAPDEYKEWVRKQNRVVEGTTSEEIARMERVIAWPGRYLIQQSYRMLVSYNLMAQAQACGDDVEPRSRRYGIFREEAQQLAWKASDIIADGLNRDKVEVF